VRFVLFGEADERIHSRILEELCAEPAKE